MIHTLQQTKKEKRTQLDGRNYFVDKPSHNNSLSDCRELLSNEVSII
jgi:hypothetical protein